MPPRPTTPTTGPPPIPSSTTNAKTSSSSTLSESQAPVQTQPAQLVGAGAGGVPRDARAGAPFTTRTFSSSSSHRARSLHEYAGSFPGSGSAYDLPSSNAMADLALVRSKSNRSVSAAYGGSSSESGNAAAPVRGRDRSAKNRGSRGKNGGDGKNKQVMIKEEEDEEDVVPELMDEDELNQLKMYDRFSDKKKRTIVTLVSFAAFMAPFSSSAFLPSIPTIAQDLNTTPTIINITVAVYIFTIGAMPLIWAPYSGLYGRRPIYLSSLPIFAAGSLGVALSDSLAALIITRMIQGIGSSAVLSVGAGSIGDIYQRQQRGTAMGYFYSGILIGPAFAPAIAGVLTEYVPNDYGWRAMQWVLCGLGAIASVLCFLFFPETAHERPIDAIKEARRQQLEASDDPKKKTWTSRLPTLVWLNPLDPLRLLLLPHILAISLNSSFVLMTTYTVLVPLSETVAPRYDITNIALLGLFYLAQGVGNACASFGFTGRMADHTLKSWLKKRQGVYVPEDRLRATLLGGGVVLPCAVLSLGWVLEKGKGKVGLAWVVILLFTNGMGLMMVLTAANTYCVDVLQHRSSEVIAVNNFARYSLSAAATAFVLPLIQTVGVGWANTLAACLAWVGFGLVCATIRWGPKMRELGEKWEGTISAGAEGRRDEEKRAGDVDEAGTKVNASS